MGKKTENTKNSKCLNCENLRLTSYEDQFESSSDDDSEAEISSDRDINKIIMDFVFGEQDTDD